MRRYRSRGSRRRLRIGRERPTGVWVAAVVAGTGFAVALAVLVAMIGLIGSGEGLTAGALRVPVGRIVIAILLGYPIAVVLLVVCGRSRSVARAWATAVLSVVIALAVSVYPLVATAAVAVGDVRQIVPWIAQLLHR